jgi:hypothetical protein
VAGTRALGVLQGLERGTGAAYDTYRNLFFVAQQLDAPNSEPALRLAASRGTTGRKSARHSKERRLAREQAAVGVLMALRFPAPAALETAAAAYLMLPTGREPPPGCG